MDYCYYPLWINKLLHIIRILNLQHEKSANFLKTLFSFPLGSEFLSKDMVGKSFQRSNLAHTTVQIKDEAESGSQIACHYNFPGRSDCNIGHFVKRFFGFIN